MCEELKGVKVCSWSELKKGDKFFVDGRNTNDHNYPKQRVFTMRLDGCGSDTGTMGNIALEHSGNNIYLRNIFKLVTEVTVPEMKKRAEELKSELAILTSKIQFCEETGCEKFDEDEFAIYHALDVLDGAGTRQEKAKALAQLLKQKK